MYVNYETHYYCKIHQRTYLKKEHKHFNCKGNPICPICKRMLRDKSRTSKILVYAVTT